jgi:hypothetical protein
MLIVHLFDPKNNRNWREFNEIWRYEVGVGDTLRTLRRTPADSFTATGREYLPPSPSLYAPPRRVASPDAGRTERLSCRVWELQATDTSVSIRARIVRVLSQLRQRPRIS